MSFYLNPQMINLQINNKVKNTNTHVKRHKNILMKTKKKNSSFVQRSNKNDESIRGRLLI